MNIVTFSTRVPVTSKLRIRNRQTTQLSNQGTALTGVPTRIRTTSTHHTQTKVRSGQGITSQLHVVRARTGTKRDGLRTTKPETLRNRGKVHTKTTVIYRHTRIAHVRNHFSVKRQVNRTLTKVTMKGTGIIQFGQQRRLATLQLQKRTLQALRGRDSNQVNSATQAVVQHLHRQSMSLLTMNILTSVSRARTRVAVHRLASAVDRDRRKLPIKDINVPIRNSNTTNMKSILLHCVIATIALPTKNRNSLQYQYQPPTLSTTLYSTRTIRVALTLRTRSVVDHTRFSRRDIRR